jgi:hypothetical protein
MVAAPRISAAAAANFAAYHARDAIGLDKAFQHLTCSVLGKLEAELSLSSDEAAPLLATALLRRTAHRVLDKRGAWGDVGAALAQHGLESAVETMRASAGG